MPSVTYDGRSFMIDGRRIWLVSGTVCYARIPAELWADRLLAAKQAGLNAIETPVIWARHEPRPGKFDFKGQNDIRQFVELAGELGLNVILRPGPFVGSGWQFGGLPSWLKGVDDLTPRAVSRPFLEASSKYLTKLADRLKDQQVTSAGKGGPIILVQNESSFTCGDDDLAAGYLGELHRYLREAGFTVPTINNNNLWQGVEGEIDAWSGGEALTAMLRQLTVVRPDQPRIVVDLSLGERSHWGETPPEPLHPMPAQRRVAEVLAAGGQYNLSPFHGGTNFGFSGGRSDSAIDAYVTTSNDSQAPLDEIGHRSEKHDAVRRISTFASQFGRVLAHADPEFRHVLVDPDAPPSSKKTAQVNVAHLRGPQGDVVFIFGTDPVHTAGKVQGGQVTLLLPDGSTLPVDLGGQAVAWCLFNVHLGGRTQLDYTNLRPFASVGSVFVCYGPPGIEGIVSINGSPMEVETPKGKKPTIIEHEGVTLVVCSEAQIDTTYVTDDAVYVGVAGLTDEGEPLSGAGSKQYTRIDSSGQSKTKNFDSSRSTPRVTERDWEVASIEDYLDGTSARYAVIEGPSDLISLGTPEGYGWYRIRLKNGATKKTRCIFPRAEDRLHVLLDGEDQGIVGYGPGAESELSLPIKKGDQTMVVLADDLGRFYEGARLGEPKGLRDHIYEATAFKVGKAKNVIAPPIDILGYRKPLWNFRTGDVTDPERIEWSFTHRKKAPILMDIGPCPVRALLVLNDEPIEYLDPSGPRWIVLEQDRLNRGKNVLQIALASDPGPNDTADIDSARKALSSGVKFYEGANPVTEKAEWAFAKWEPPKNAAYQEASRSAITAARGPTWWRMKFSVSGNDAPLVFDPTGLTKGQIYLNGEHVGRYFVGLPGNRVVAGQALYYLPEPWLKTDEDNELVIFDEHGGNPTRSKLSFVSGK